MLKNIRRYVAFAFLIAALGARADGVKSFSKQMNEIKRSGDYVYAESSASNEDDAKTACDDMLKIEITKYLVSADTRSQAEGHIVKSIADYNCEYLVQLRGDMIRVFGYVAKKNIIRSKMDGNAPASEKKNGTTGNGDKKTETTKKAEDVIVLQWTSPNDSPTENDLRDAEVAKPVTQLQGEKLKIGGLQLSKWQIDLLESVVNEPDMMQAKKLLNRYKYQNRIKRLGNKSISNPRPADSFYLIYGDSGKPVALLAPSSTKTRYNMLSGATDNFDNYSGNQFFWFQISK